MPYTVNEKTTIDLFSMLTYNIVHDRNVITQHDGL
jgi:hypothetical protein